MPYKPDDITKLLPAFRQRVQELLNRLGGLGLQPVLHDGLRTAAEAAVNAQTGHGIKDSMHLYGCAADIICDQHGWDCHKFGCPFYNVLGSEAEALKLTWGRHFSRSDDCHVQAIPVRMQDQIRNAKSPDARNAIVAKYLG